MEPNPSSLLLQRSSLTQSDKPIRDILNSLSEDNFHCYTLSTAWMDHANKAEHDLDTDSCLLSCAEQVINHFGHCAGAQRDALYETRHSDLNPLPEDYNSDFYAKNNVVGMFCMQIGNSIFGAHAIAISAIQPNSTSSGFECLLYDPDKGVYKIAGNTPQEIVETIHNYIKSVAKDHLYEKYRPHGGGVSVLTDVVTDCANHTIARHITADELKTPRDAPVPTAADIFVNERNKKIKEELEKTLMRSYNRSDIADNDEMTGIPGDSEDGLPSFGGGCVASSVGNRMQPSSTLK